MVVDHARIGRRGDDRVGRPLELEVAHVEVVHVGARSRRPQLPRTPRCAPRRRSSNGAGSAARRWSAGRCAGACGTSTARAPARAPHRARRGERGAPSALRGSARARRVPPRRSRPRSRADRPAARGGHRRRTTRPGRRGRRPARSLPASRSSARASVSPRPAAICAASCSRVFSRASSALNPEMSQPTASRPSPMASTSVVPDPQNGSRTSPPSAQCRRISASASCGGNLPR